MRRALRWALGFLVLLGAAAVASAQNTGVNPIPGSVWTYLGATYGAGWAVPPVVNLPYAPNNGVLVGTAPVTAQIYRAGFYTPGDGGGMIYTHAASACSLAAGLGDNGSQVKAADGGCWLAAFPATGGDARVWGVKFDNATDNSTTLAAAMAWAALGNRLVLPSVPLAAQFGTPISVAFATTGASLTVAGGGPDQSMLAYTGASGTGIAVNYNVTDGKLNHVHFRDFGYCTTHAGGPTGLSVTETVASSPGQIAGSDITNVTFRGCDGYSITDYWATAIGVSGVSNLNYVGLRVFGAGGTALGLGVNITGTGSIYAFSHNFVSVTLNQLAVGINVGQNTQGLTITAGSNMTNVTTGLNVPAGINGTDQFTIADSQFECTNACIIAGTADLFVHHNYFILNANGAIGIDMPANNSFTIDHNSYRNGGSATGLIGELMSAPSLMAGHINNNTYISLQYSHYYQGPAHAFADFITDNVYVSGGGTIIAPGSTALMDLGLPFASVTPCSATTLGRFQAIGDSPVNTWGAPVTTGGGVNQVTMSCNGTAWTVFSK